MLDQCASQGPPDPTAHALVDRLRAQTPPEFQYLIQDLVKKITLCGNRTVEAVATKSPDGKYRVKLVVACEKFKAEEVDRYERLKRGEFDEVRNFEGMGRLFIALRISQGMTQRELAERLEIHESQVSSL